MTIRRRLLSAVLLSVAAGCGGEKPVGPVAGDLIVSYTSPSATDGALLLLVVGGPVTGVTAASAGTVDWAAVGPNATRVVVTGSLSAGDVVRLQVPDVGAHANYAVQVEAAADRATFALIDPALYSATIRE